MKNRFFFAVLFLFSALNWTISAQDGFPDTNFLNGIQFQLLSNGDNFAYDVDVQKDGKIVIVGSQKNNNSRNIVVMKLHEDGSPDHSFNEHGYRVFNIGNSLKDCGRSVRVIEEKILVGGCSGNNAFLLRLNSDGNPDSTFGQGGLKLITSLSVINDISVIKGFDAYSIFAAGSITVGNESRPAISKFSSDGSQDLHFGQQGVSKIDSWVNGHFSEIAINNAGEIFACGSLEKQGIDEKDALVAKFDSAGNLDKNFGTDLGYVVIDAPEEGRRNSAESLFLGKNDKITICGTYESIKDDDAYVFRLNEDGSLDNAFGDKKDGFYKSEYINETDESKSIVIQNDGKIIIGGRTDFEGNFDFNLTRLNANGKPDTTFGCNSWQLKDFSSGHDSIKAMYLKSNHYLITVGNHIYEKSNQIAVAKFKISDTRPLKSKDLADF